MSSRHISRMSALQALFAADVRGELSLAGVIRMLEEQSAAMSKDGEDRSFTERLISGISAKREEIDAVIERAAPEWPLAKIALVDRNILRIGLFELLYGGGSDGAEGAVPPKVALNEAIELAKTFGGESSGRFVNGVLGSVYRELGSPRKDEAPKAEKEYFAGVLVCAAEEGGLILVALVKDAFDTWTLPKVAYAAGELSDAAALRAAREVLGIAHVTLKAPLSEHEYEAHEPGRGALVRRAGYFLACAKKSALSVAPGKSVLEAAWFREDELDALALYEDVRGTIRSGILAAKRHCL